MADSEDHSGGSATITLSVPRCCLCYHEIFGSDDVILMREMDRCIYRNCRMHFICWVLRMNCSIVTGKSGSAGMWLTNEEFTGMSTGTNHGSGSGGSVVPLTCSDCKLPINEDTGTDVVLLHCQHAATHLRCMSIYTNLRRRLGCPICVADRRAEAKQLEGWRRKVSLRNHHQQQHQQRQMVVPILKRNISRDEQQHAAYSGMIKMNIEAGAKAAMIKEQYAGNLACFEEPAYPTPMRKLAFESNQQMISNGNGNVICHRSEYPPLFYWLLAGARFTPQELLDLGLTFQLALGTPKDRVGLLTLSWFPWKLLTSPQIGVTLLKLALAGITVDCLGTDIVPSEAEFELLEFHGPMFIAAGGSPAVFNRFPASVVKAVFDADPVAIRSWRNHYHYNNPK
jgi:hypothetical protein